MRNFGPSARYSLAVIAVLLSALTQCKSTPSEPPPQAQGTPDQTYTVRGKILSMPTTHAGTAEVQHEAIPTFLNAAKEQVGMAAMTMPFNLAPQIRLDQFKPGDTVSFTFEVRWSSDPQLLIRDMSLLPDGVQLQP